MRSLQKISIIILVITLSLPISQGSVAFNPNNVTAIQYRIDQEWVTLWINDDASIELHYNITITYESSAEGYISLGLPTRDFNTVSVKDLSGNNLNWKDISGGSYYGIEVDLGHSMGPGEGGTVLLISTFPAPSIIQPDEMNPGYLGLQFMPTYFEDARVEDLRLAIVPPNGVTKENIKTSEDAYYTTVDGEFAVYWERNNLPPNTKLVFGVSVPEQYITIPPPAPPTGPDIWFYLSIFLGIVGIFIVIILLRKRKEVYQKPKIKIEALGPARSLTAVEAAVVVGLKPVRVLTMVLFSLLLKRFIKIKEIEPLIKVEKLLNQSEEPKQHPRYYEIDFLRAIGPNGSLNERRLAGTYISLRENVDKKMRGYARKDTVNYYKSIVNTAWNQVKQASTPQLAEETLEKNLEWLLLDEKYGQRFKEAFPPHILFMPRPNWYWYGPHFSSKTTTTPTGPSTAVEVKPIPAQEFADKIVTGIEEAAGGLVKNVEDFTKRLIPPKVSTQSSRPIRHKSRCVCACANCACACACVSCACACAGGGAR
jgi:hypothetical protein